MKQRTESLANRYLAGTSSNSEEQELAALLRDEEPTDTVRALRIMLEDRNESSLNNSRSEVSVRFLRIGMWVAAAVAAIFVITVLQEPRQEQTLKSEAKPVVQVAKPQIREVPKAQGSGAKETGNPTTSANQSKPCNFQSQPSTLPHSSPMSDEVIIAEGGEQINEELAMRFASAESENNQLRNELLKYYDNETV